MNKNRISISHDPDENEVKIYVDDKLFIIWNDKSHANKSWREDLSLSKMIIDMFWLGVDTGKVVYKDRS